MTKVKSILARHATRESVLHASRDLPASGMVSRVVGGCMPMCVWEEWKPAKFEQDGWGRSDSTFGGSQTSFGGCTFRKSRTRTRRYGRSFLGSGLTGHDSDFSSFVVYVDDSIQASLALTLRVHGSNVVQRYRSALEVWGWIYLHNLACCTLSASVCGRQASRRRRHRHMKTSL